MVIDQNMSLNEKMSALLQVLEAAIAQNIELRPQMKENLDRLNATLQSAKHAENILAKTVEQWSQRCQQLASINLCTNAEKEAHERRLAEHHRGLRNVMENKALRKQFKNDPRVHFLYVLNTAGDPIRPRKKTTK
jgi:hypothetical protein